MIARRLGASLAVIRASALLPNSLWPGAAANITRQQAQEHHERLRAALDTKNEARIQAAETRWQAAEADFEEARGELIRLPDYWEPPFSWLYWVILSALAIVETAVVKPSVTALLDASVPTTDIIAGALAISLIALAHWTGVAVRRFEYARVGPVELVAAMLLLALLIVLIFAMSFGIAISQTLAPSGNQVMMRGFIFVVGLALLSTGAVIAFFRHDPHPNYEELDLERKRSHRALDGLRRRHDGERAAEDRRFAMELRRNGW